MKKLLKTLTIDEKIGQLSQLPPFFYVKDLENEVAGVVKEFKLNEKYIFSSGSVLGVGSASEMKEIQTKYLAKTKHKIPLIFMADIIHGYKSIFPVPLALAATWNKDLVKKAARISAKEAQTAGIHVTFAPMADLARDPRWGRVVEGFGEDPYLTGVFAQAMVEGFQDDDIAKEGSLAACVKHYAAYGASEGGRDYNTVDISRVNLHQNYMVGYQKAIEAGAKLIMTSFNVLDGIPATTNKYLLREILRKRWGFEGVVISDFASLAETLKHGTSKDEFEAAIKGLDAGLDIEMTSTIYLRFLKQAIEEKYVDEALLDEAVLRILNLKKELGLFDNPFKGANEVLEKTYVLSEENLDATEEVASEAIVLLKNENVLPLKEQKIALIGPYARNQAMNGPWSWHGKKEDSNSIYDVLKKDRNITFVHDATTFDMLSNADIQAIMQADTIVLALGEETKQSGEAHSRSDIHLPFGQESLIEALHKLGKPIVLVLINGRPLVLSNISEKVSAIVETFFLGTRAAEAITSVLVGKTNPSGKLTMSFPRNVGQIPVYYNHLRTGRPFDPNNKEYTSHYLDIDNTPLFNFGFGLSYSTFEYSNYQISSNKMNKDQKIMISVDVTNTSQIDGKEIVQVYIKDHYAHVARPYMELKHFDKQLIKANETKTFKFEISINDLMYVGSDTNLTFDTGTFSIYVGSNIDSLHEFEFELEK